MAKSPKNQPNTIRIHPDLCGRILDTASLGLPRMEFLREVARMLAEFIQCDSVEIRIVRREKVWRCKESAHSEKSLRQEIRSGRRNEAGQFIPCIEEESDLETLCAAVLLERLPPASPLSTPLGNFWAGDVGQLSWDLIDGTTAGKPDFDEDFSSIVIIRFSIVPDGDGGLLLLRAKQKNFFTGERVLTYEYVARILGIALNQRRAQIALRERIKQLTCLYGITRVAANPHISLEDILRETVELLPQGWLHKDVASAVIDLDGRSYATDGFRESPYMLSTYITINGEKRGVVTIAYSKAMPQLDEGPFLKEERDFLELVAGEIALMIEAKQMETEREVLQEQLRHADRLATIGQLAAGVAHELNEPLSSILGRAQLIGKIPDLSGPVKRDSEKIVAASLHAREVINKLRLFARHSPPKKESVNLNEVVRDGLYLLESRCAKAGIDLVKSLDEHLPNIIADSGQLYQILINLVVNAVQATPDGGRITIRTRIRDNGVALRVEDTGAGMDAATLRQVFTPFFTTKEVDEGTGLGLAVVHGIVTSHGGKIAFDSKLGRGTCFEVVLPLTPPDELGEQKD